jgi:hypothetical protein
VISAAPARRPPRITWCGLAPSDAIEGEILAQLRRLPRRVLLRRVLLEALSPFEQDFSQPDRYRAHLDALVLTEGAHVRRVRACSGFLTDPREAVRHAFQQCS